MKIKKKKRRAKKSYINKNNKNKSKRKSSPSNIYRRKNKVTQKKEISVVKEKKITKAKAQLILALVATATASSILTTYTVKQTYKSNENESISNNEETYSELSQVGEKIENSGLLELKPIFGIDTTFDSRFDNIRGTITDIYASCSESNEKLQEVFIIKTTNKELVVEEMNKYRDELKKNAEENPENKHNINVLSDSIIDTKDDIVYLIIAKKPVKIQKRILKYI